MNFDLHSPCIDCPFLRARKFPLARARVRDILNGIIRGQQTFACHKTVEHDDDGEPVLSADQQHCAGALILLERIDRPNQMMRISERLGFYDRHKLKMNADVFDNEREMMAARHWTAR